MLLLCTMLEIKYTMLHEMEGFLLVGLLYMCVNISRCVWGAWVCRSVHVWRPKKTAMSSLVTLTLLYWGSCLSAKDSCFGLLLQVTLILVLPALICVLRWHTSYQLFMWVLGTWSLVLTLLWQTLYQKSHLPGPLKHHLYHILLHFCVYFASVTTVHTFCSSFRGPWARR